MVMTPVNLIFKNKLDTEAITRNYFTYSDTGLMEELPMPSYG